MNVVNKIKLYLKICENSFLALNAYKVNTLSRILYSILLFFIQMYLWRTISLYNNTFHELKNYNIILYVLLSTCISVFIGFDTNYIPKIGEKIITGNISVDLIKPISLRAYMFFDYLGMCVYKLFFNLLPIVIIILIAINVDFNFGLKNILFFISSILLASILYFLLCFTIGLLGFWYTSIGQLHIIIDSSITLFSGSIVPIWFISGKFAFLINILPFKYMYYSPISILTEELGLNSCIEIILVQLFWILIFGLLSSLLYKIGCKKIEVQGG